MSEAFRNTLEAPLAELAALAPRLRLDRRLHDGAWVVGLAGDRVRDAEAFGRVAFELRALPDDARVSCSFRATAGGKDLTSRHCELSPDDQGAAALAEFAESALLAFAKAYFVIGSTTTRSASS